MTIKIKLKFIEKFPEIFEHKKITYARGQNERKEINIKEFEIYFTLSAIGTPVLVIYMDIRQKVFYHPNYHQSRVAP